MSEKPNSAELVEISKPVPGAGEIGVKVVTAGLCGSDVHFLRGESPCPSQTPVTMGHEFSGIVDSIGEGVNDFKPGDRIVSETAYGVCGTCEMCRRGFYHICINKKTLGYWYDGVFAEYSVTPAVRAKKIPDGISFLTAAMLEPMACTVHALYEQCTIKAGDIAVVNGPGAMGQIAAQIAKAQGAIVVITGTDADADRLKLALELGADYAVNVQQTDLTGFVKELTGGVGADVVIECSGNERGIGSAVECIRKKGYYTQIGLPGRKISFDLDAVCSKELHFNGSMSSNDVSWRRAITLLEKGLVKLEPLGQTMYGLSEWEEAFAAFDRKEGYKIMIDPAR